MFTLLRAFLYAYGGICAAKVLHKKLLLSILKAPVAFFDVTPVSWTLCVSVNFTMCIIIIQVIMHVHVSCTTVIIILSFNFYRLAELSIDFHLIWYVIVVLFHIAYMYIHMYRLRMPTLILSLKNPDSMSHSYNPIVGIITMCWFKVMPSVPFLRHWHFTLYLSSSSVSVSF